MRKEAEANREADEKRKEEADTKNEAEQLILATEKSIKDLGDKIDASDKEKAESEIKDLKDALSSGKVEDIKAKKDKLQETTMALAAKVYEQAAKESQAKTESSEEPKKDDVIDAEYEEK